jgi:hypothetical protein
MNNFKIRFFTDICIYKRYTRMSQKCLKKETFLTVSYGTLVMNVSERDIHSAALLRWDNKIELGTHSYMSQTLLLYDCLQWKWDSNGNLRWDNLAISRAFQQNPICNTWQLLFLPTFRNNFRLTEEKKKKKKKRKIANIVW